MEGDEIGLEPVSGVQYPVTDHWVYLSSCYTRRGTK